MRNEATAAAGFVHAGAADGDAFLGFEGALGVVSGLAALHADGVRLGDMASSLFVKCFCLQRHIQ